jgi:hypothetical protein
VKTRTPATGLRIAMCEKCSIALPLTKSLTSFESRIWVCQGCDHVIKGQLASDYTIDELRNVHPEAVVFDRAQLAPPSPELLKTTERIPTDRSHAGRDKRRAVRYSVKAAIPVQPFDAMLQPIEAPFMSVARNISTGGICLLSDRTIHAEFLGLELSATAGELVQLLVQVMRSRPRGNVYEIGGEFITKMAAPRVP